jgi:hypothetical protein
MAGGGVEQSAPSGRSDFDSGSTSVMRDIHRKHAEAIDTSDTTSGQSSYESTPGVGGGMGHANGKSSAPHEKEPRTSPIQTNRLPDEKSRFDSHKPE